MVAAAFCFPAYTSPRGGRGIAGAHTAKQMSAEARCLPACASHCPTTSAHCIKRAKGVRTATALRKRYDMRGGRGRGISHLIMVQPSLHALLTQRHAAGRDAPPRWPHTLPLCRASALHMRYHCHRSGARSAGTRVKHHRARTWYTAPRHILLRLFASWRHMYLSTLCARFSSAASSTTILGRRRRRPTAWGKTLMCAVSQALHVSADLRRQRPRPGLSWADMNNYAAPRPDKVVQRHRHWRRPL